MKILQSRTTWGRRRNPNNWTYESIPTFTLLDRGFTGHEHLSEFNLVNMNGRLYDPLIARMLSPDPYVQIPDFAQNFNRYSYCLNNPFKYTDPSGEFFWSIITGIFETAKAIIKSDFAFWKTVFSGGLEFWHANKDYVKDAWGKGFGVDVGHTWADWDPTYKGTNFNNAWRLDRGLFFEYGPNFNAWDVISRFTWELPQTLAGYHYGGARIISGNCDKVEYFDGVSVLVGAGQGGSVTLGNFMALSPLVGNPSWTNQTFIHEFGHTRQSKIFGLSYLYIIGINSVISTETEDDFGESWTEILANNIGLNYAIEKHGYNRNNWQNRQDFPLGYDAQSFWPWWLRLINQ